MTTTAETITGLFCCIIMMYFVTFIVVIFLNTSIFVGFIISFAVPGYACIAYYKERTETLEAIERLNHIGD